MSFHPSYGCSLSGGVCLIIDLFTDFFLDFLFDLFTDFIIDVFLLDLFTDLSSTVVFLSDSLTLSL